MNEVQWKHFTMTTFDIDSYNAPRLREITNIARRDCARLQPRLREIARDCTPRLRPRLREVARGHRRCTLRLCEITAKKRLHGGHVASQARGDPFPSLPSPPPCDLSFCHELVYDIAPQVGAIEPSASDLVWCHWYLVWSRVISGCCHQ